MNFFGTDGIRARVGSPLMSPDFLVKLGMAIGHVLCNTTARPKVLIGRDTRRSGYMIESALEAGLSAGGVDVLLVGAMPTPGVAYLTHTFHADAGIVISASHNPHFDNGIKLFSSKGEKLDDDLQLQIETALSENLTMVEPENIGHVARVKDAPARYIEFCKATTKHFFNLSGLKLVIDCAHGATYKIAPSVFQELGADVTVIGCAPDGLNINDGFGSTQPANLQAAVIEHQADVGIAFDGDGDRLVMVDQHGVLVDGDEILYILAKDAQGRGALGSSGVVGTLMSNFGLEQAFARDNIPFVRTKVGDRYVMQALKSHQWMIGGESSGHIIWLDSTTTGDGIVAALQVLAVMQSQQKPLRTLLDGLTKTPQVLINVALDAKLSDQDLAILQKEADMAETKLNGKGRVLLRPSGTEPVLRVMVEGEDLQFVEKLAQELADTCERKQNVT